MTQPYRFAHTADARESVHRASGFVQTGLWEVQGNDETLQLAKGLFKLELVS
jgi:hypothetical protein